MHLTELKTIREHAEEELKQAELKLRLLQLRYDELKMTCDETVLETSIVEELKRTNNELSVELESTKNRSNTSNQSNQSIDTTQSNLSNQSSQSIDTTQSNTVAIPILELPVQVLSHEVPIHEVPKSRPSSPELHRRVSLPKVISSAPKKVSSPPSSTRNSPKKSKSPNNSPNAIRSRNVDAFKQNVEDSMKSNKTDVSKKVR